MREVEKTENEWKRELGTEKYHIIREKGTEQAFSGKYVDHHENGMYICTACGAELFTSDTKFDSGTGWPSFTKPAIETNVEHVKDSSHGMHRTEVICNRCGAHLGHVFDDGPEKLSDGSPATGKRYCINSASLDFTERKK